MFGATKKKDMFTQTLLLRIQEDLRFCLKDSLEINNEALKNLEDMAQLDKRIFMGS